MYSVNNVQSPVLTLYSLYASLSIAPGCKEATLSTDNVEAEKQKHSQ